jgi:hypothetical protein
VVLRQARIALCAIEMRLDMEEAAWIDSLHFVQQNILYGLVSGYSVAYFAIKLHFQCKSRLLEFRYLFNRWY